MPPPALRLTLLNAADFDGSPSVPGELIDRSSCLGSCYTVESPRAVWATCQRGDHDTAILQVKEVEVSVREACKYTDEDIGVPMMKKAFAVSTVPLTDTQALRAEQEHLLGIVDRRSAVP